MRRDTSRAGLWAILLSLGLHLGLLGWAVTRPPLPEPPPRRTTSLVFIDVQPKAEPVKPPAEPTRVPPQKRPGASGVAAPVPAVAPPDAPTSDRPVADAPSALPPPGSLGRAMVLVPGSAFAIRLDAGTLEEEVAPGGLAARTPEQIIDDLAKETLGKGRVERGLVHSYYGDLGRALLKNWDADRVAKSGLKGFADQFVQNSKIYNELWADRAAAYGRGGSPLDNDTLAPNRHAAPNDRIQGLQGVDLEARKEFSREMGSAFKATRRATIRVVQDRDGKLVRVELVKPSNDSQVDKEALKDVRAAAEKLPRPPDDVLGGRDQLSSLWSFELIVSISPPMPVFTFEFDEALGFIDARLPLDRRIYKKVRLEAVE